MSIRFRLSLLYTVILFLTLLVFGISLYSIQAQDTLNALKDDLLKSSEKMVDIVLKPSNEHQNSTQHESPPPPKTFDEFSGQQTFQDLREREIIRILDAEGNLVASPFGREDDALPLTDTGLAALQNQEEWWSEDFLNDEPMLIYNRPVVQNGEVIAIIQAARSLVERERTLQSLAVTLLGAGLLTIFIAFGIGWLFTGVSLRPIDRITQTAQAIGEERNFERRVNYEGPQDEVGRLANTFNQMLSGLQEAYQKVSHALTIQRNFVADVSHELRTPLTTLRGNLGLMQRDAPPLPQEEQIDILKDMVEESDRLIRLVNELLLLARADAGRNLNKEIFDLSPIIQETTRQIQLLDPRRQILLTTPENQNIIGDRDAVKQILLILLDNAIKHTDSDIKITVTPTGKLVTIEIKDDGQGIGPEILPHIFDRFYRGEDPQRPGFGLGLPIAKTLVESMDGTINIKSKPDQGTLVLLVFNSGQTTTSNGIA